MQIRLTGYIQPYPIGRTRYAQTQTKHDIQRTGRLHSTHVYIQRFGSVARNYAYSLTRGLTPSMQPPTGGDSSKRLSRTFVHRLRYEYIVLETACIHETYRKLPDKRGETPAASLHRGRRSIITRTPAVCELLLLYTHTAPSPLVGQQNAEIRASVWRNLPSAGVASAACTSTASATPASYT